MELGRRGFFFSLISLLLLIGLFYLAQPLPYETTLTSQQASQERIVFTNAIIQNFEIGYLNRAVESQSFFVLEALSRYLNDTGELFTSRDELEANFSEGLIEGTFGGGSVKVTDYLPAGYSGAQHDLLTLLDAYANASGQSYNLRFNFSDKLSDYHVTLEQDATTGPWQIRVDLSIPYNVTPALILPGDDTANWTLNHSVSAYVNIKGITDPYLLVESGGKIESSIREFYTERWSLATFHAFVGNGSYYPYNGSMSLLGRYYDSMEYSDCCGLVTTINRTRYDAYHDSSLNPGFANVSFLDCGYFPGSAVTPWCRQGEDRLIYAVRGISDYTIAPGTNLITDPTSSFPFTVPGRFGSELFNMTIGSDMIDVYTAIS